METQADRDRRKNDPEYQAKLRVKWAAELRRENSLTLANAIEHDRLGTWGRWRGHAQAVRMFQGAV